MYIINHNNWEGPIRLFQTRESAAKYIKDEVKGIAAYLRYNGFDLTIQQNVDGTAEVYVPDMNLCHQWWIQECEMSEDMPVVLRSISESQVRKTEQILADNGVDPNKISAVLQTLGNTLLKEDLCPEDGCGVETERMPVYIMDYFDNNCDDFAKLYRTWESAVEGIKKVVEGIASNLRNDGYDPTILQNIDGSAEVYVSDTGIYHQWQLQERKLSENIPAVLQNISENRIQKAEQILAGNGIDPDEASTVLQAVGYALLDAELYPEN